MEYTYFFELKANISISLEEINVNNMNNVTNINNGINMINILCYNINNDSKYPFLQFMMEKIPYCNNFIKEQFILPYIMYTDLSTDIKTLSLNKVKTSLKEIGCSFENINESMYKGIIHDNNGIPYILINTTGIDINGLRLSRNTLTWFVLPSEIINTKEICNIDIDNEVTDLFTNVPELSLLTNIETDNYFIIPDAVYTGSEIKDTEFNSIFGNRMMKIFNSCRKYYYFYRTFGNAVKEGGWIKQGGDKLIDKNNKLHTHSLSGDRLIIENDYGKYIHGAINRYALFIEGQIYNELTNEFSLSDTIIETKYPETSIIICYSNLDNLNPDILVKEYDNFVSLSYHSLNKSLLGDNYSSENKHKYMIL